MTEKKAQASAEFLVILSLAILLLTLVVILYSGEDRNNYITQERLRARHTAQKIASAANQAFLSGNGTRIYLDLDRDYNISLGERSIRVARGSESGSFPLATANVTNSTPLNNSFSVTITNQNGVVFLA